MFGVYALVLLLALLVFGSLSDYAGRRPVILAGLVLEIAATAVFLGAKGVGWLYVARILQGAAVGSAVLFLGGVGVAGLAYGPVFGAVFRSLAALAAPTERAGMVSSIYVVCYVAVSVPSFAAGIAATHWGLQDASLGDAAFAALLTALVAGNALIRRVGGRVPGRRPGVRSLPHCPAAAPMPTDVIYANER